MTGHISYLHCRNIHSLPQESWGFDLSPGIKISDVASVPNAAGDRVIPIVSRALVHWTSHLEGVTAKYLSYLGTYLGMYTARQAKVQRISSVSSGYFAGESEHCRLRRLHQRDMNY